MNLLANRIIKSKTLKVFMIAIVLVFSYEVNKPKAIAPVLYWAGTLIAGAVAEEAVEMGVRHVTGTGKNNTKSKTKKIATEIIEESAGFDFPTKKPIRKADGSLEIPMSANDRAKIAKKIADEFDDVIEADGARRSKTSKPTYDIDVMETDPMYKTSISLDIVPTDVNLAGSLKAVDFFRSLVDVRFTPVAFQKQTRVEMFSAVTGKVYTDVSFYGGNAYTIKLKDFNYGSSSPYQSGTNLSAGYAFFYADVPSSTNTPPGSKYVYSDAPTINLYINYLKVLESMNSQIYYADGIAVPGTLKNVYPAGTAMPSTYKLPNETQLTNKPFKVPNLYPAGESDIELEWETVKNDYEIDNSQETKYEQNIDTYLEKGDINNVTNTYNTQTINNYYTDRNYDTKSEDIKIDIDIDIDNTVTNPPATGDDGDDLPTGTRPDPVETLDRSLLDVMKQSYDYLGDSIDTAIVSMRDVTDNATGLISYLDESFDWLPASWRALFGSAFILGVFAHFFRR